MSGQLQDNANTIAKDIIKSLSSKHATHLFADLANPKFTAISWASTVQFVTQHPKAAYYLNTINTSSLPLTKLYGSEFPKALLTELTNETHIEDFIQNNKKNLPKFGEILKNLGVTEDMPSIAQDIITGPNISKVVFSNPKLTKSLITDYMKQDYPNLATKVANEVINNPEFREGITGIISSVFKNFTSNVDNSSPAPILFDGRLDPNNLPKEPEPPTLSVRHPKK